MTQKAALETLIHIDPTRSYCVAVNEWHHSNSPGGLSSDIHVSVFPRDGGGHIPEQFHGRSIAGAFHKAKNYLIRTAA